MKTTPAPSSRRAFTASRWFRLFLGGWYHAFRNIQTTMSAVVDHGGSRPVRIAAVFVSLVVIWFVYVPIHELLHVAGCIATGGTVQELVMGTEYGAEYLQTVFPFIVPETTRYAGRLTGFEPNGDWGYLATVFAPFLLSIFPGVLCLLLAETRRSAVCLGAGIVIGMAPFYNLTGDFFEIGTIISTRVINLVAGGGPAAGIENFWLIRSDDVFRLIGEMADAPAKYGFHSLPVMAYSVLAVTAGLALAILISGWTFHAGWSLSRRITPASGSGSE